MENADEIVERIVENPHTTYAQFKADLEAGKQDAGVQRAAVNLTTLMGGFHRFYGNEAEQRACARYRALWDASQVGGARAVDPSREPVDGGWLNPEAVFENGADARKLYSRITEHLGRMDTNRLHFVVIGEWGPTAYAKHFYRMRQPDGKAVSRAKVEVRQIAANLATFLDLIGAAPNRTVMRGDGDKPDTFTGEISTRRVA